ncbi:hypothetical protein BDE02_03G068600 [Populus trichocarpa]|nr:hypothetical protein BDE02_03G068600 [Populus trichocarpa]
MRVSIGTQEWGTISGHALPASKHHLVEACNEIS